MAGEQGAADIATQSLTAVQAAGEKLIAALIDNIAAGQVETLHSLQSASAMLRRNAAKVADSVHAELAATTTSLVQQVVAELTAHAEAVQAQIGAGGASLLDAIEQASSALTVAAQKAEQQASHAREALDWAAEEVSARLEAATTLWESQTAASEAALAAAGDHLVTRIQAAATSAVAQINEAAEGLDSFLASVDAEVSGWRARDTKQATRMDERLTAFITRTEQAMTAAATALQQQSELLAQRDSDLEARRADEFVRALERVLAGAGLRGRGVRKRVAQSLEDGRLEEST